MFLPTNKGVSFRMGKWTKAENELLRKNWIRFFKVDNVFT